MKIIESCGLNFDRFNFENIATKIRGIEDMNDNTTRSIKAHVCDRAFAYYSDNQLLYVGNTRKGESVGYDFVGINNNLKYEMKSLKKLFDKKGNTQLIIMKNFQGNRDETRNRFEEWKIKCQENKPFDFLFMFDSVNFKMIITSWETVFCRAYNMGSNVNIKLKKEDYEVVVENIIPRSERKFSEDLEEVIEKYIKS